MRPGAGHSSRGFTLIEIIVTFVIVAVMGTMIYTYLGKAFSESVTPVLQLQKFTDLHRTMENIRAAYRGNPKWRSNTAYTKDISIVIPTNPNGRSYTCTQSGTSGATEPVWFQGGPYTDGTVQWGVASSPVVLTTLKTSIGAEGADQDNAYGKYYVVANRFILFNPVTGAEQDDASGKNNILKVIIRNTTADTSNYKLGGFLEALFYSY
jgi:prepilin-type N-terminal cleavage/methylation domain-containing protein